MVVAILKAEILVGALKSPKRLQTLKLSSLYTHGFLFPVKPVVWLSRRYSLKFALNGEKGSSSY